MSIQPLIIIGKTTVFPVRAYAVWSFGIGASRQNTTHSEIFLTVCRARTIMQSSFVKLYGSPGFDQEDLRILFEAILNMYEHDHSASKGEMSVVSPLILFRHVGTDTDERQRIRQAKLGCAPAHKLFELVKVAKKPGVEVPRSYRDYDAAIDLKHIPEGVEVGFQTYAGIAWGKLPEDENWFHEA